MSDKQRVVLEPYWPNVERFLECMVDDDRTEPEARKHAKASLAEVKAYLDDDPKRRTAKM